MKRTASGRAVDPSVPVDPMDVCAEEARLMIETARIVDAERTKARLSVQTLADRARMGFPRTTQVLEGLEIMTMGELASLGLACGVRWEIRTLGGKPEPKPAHGECCGCGFMFELRKDGKLKAHTVLVARLSDGRQSRRACDGQGKRPYIRDTGK